MGKRKQKGKSMTMADRERLRLQTNLVGVENQHVVTGDIGNENMRCLHGRNVPIPIPPPGIPPEVPKNKIPPYPDSAESFDPGISLPIPPTTPEPITSQMAQTVKGTVSKTNSILVSPQPKQKPPIPPRPTLLSNRDTNIQGVSSEMESDDYHHISEHLQRAAAKNNKTKLAITLQDKDKPPSQLSESDVESVTDPERYPYDDGEVIMKKVMFPEQ